MTSQEFKKIAEKLPDAPGIYFFKDAKNGTLYIGKATSLRDRTRSYFAADLIETRGPKIVDMVTQAVDIDFVQTDSVLEALILEANLIKEHQPKYNTDEKDNKSYNYVIITNEEFPKVGIERGRIVNAQEGKYKYVFGPFPHGGQLKEALHIVRKIFPYSDSKCTPAQDQIEAGRTPRPCFNRQIGLCPGVCTGEISKKDYGRQIQNIKLFFEGKKREILKNLEKEMKEYAKAQEFEKAVGVRQTIFALNHIHDIALLKRENKLSHSSGGTYSVEEEEKLGRIAEPFRIEAYDVAHSSGKNVVGVMVVVEDGEVKKSDYRKFNIKNNPGNNDIASLSEIIRRRLGNLDWPMPNLIVVDGAEPQRNVAEKILAERNLSINVVAVVKDDRHKARAIIGDQKITDTHGSAILLANSESHRFAVAFHRKKRDRIL